MKVSGYGSIFSLGHREILNLLSSPVVVEEKVDGSQFSFRLKDGVIGFRSKGQEIYLEAPEKMFIKAVEAVKDMPLIENWVYRGEYLRSPKHNVLAYGRVPVKHIILFDIERSEGTEDYLLPDERTAEGLRLGLECVPVFYTGMVESLDFLKEFLLQDSVLGGCKIEGVVVKNYNLFGADKKFMMGKLVSEAFKETMGGEWKKANPSKTDLVQSLIKDLAVPARYQKAFQHLQEEGKITGEMRDIGSLVKETQDDLLKEESGEVKEALFNHFWGQIVRGVVAGVPLWYKAKLAEESFAPPVEE
jgi:hypothetical protein